MEIRGVDFEKKVKEIYEDVKKDENGRYLSWEHCYTEFYNSRNKKELSEEKYNYLALHLAFYLASWGMYRGSSFILQKDYKIHIPIVKEILKNEYNALLGIECYELQENKTNQELLEELNKKLRKHYKGVREKVNDSKSKISDTLITKILMGTLACVPAYDRYFNYAVKKYKISTATYNVDSILKLCEFYEINKEVFDKEITEMYINGNNVIPYPQMKFLDIGFWKIGYDEDPKNKGKNLH